MYILYRGVLYVADFPRDPTREKYFLRMTEEQATKWRLDHNNVRCPDYWHWDPVRRKCTNRDRIAEREADEGTARGMSLPFVDEEWQKQLVHHPEFTADFAHHMFHSSQLNPHMGAMLLNSRHGKELVAKMEGAGDEASRIAFEGLLRDVEVSALDGNGMKLYYDTAKRHGTCVGRNFGGNQHLTGDMIEHFLTHCGVASFGMGDKSFAGVYAAKLSKQNIKNIWKKRPEPSAAVARIMLHAEHATPEMLRASYAALASKYVLPVAMLHNTNLPEDVAQHAALNFPALYDAAGSNLSPAAQKAKPVADYLLQGKSDPRDLQKLGVPTKNIPKNIDMVAALSHFQVKELPSRQRVADFQRAIEKETGNKTSLAHVLEAYRADSFSMEFTELTLFGPKLEFTATFRDASGEDMGSITRTVEVDKNEVTHDFFELSDKLQGRGYGNEVMKQQLDLYEKIGAEIIHTTTGMEVGPFLWPMYGFDWDEGAEGMSADEQRQMVRTSFLRWLVGQGYIEKDAKAFVNSLHSAWDFAASEDPAFRVEKPKTREEAERHRIGKRFLLDTKPTLYLALDLMNPDHMRINRAYIIAQDRKRKQKQEHEEATLRPPPAPAYKGKHVLRAAAVGTPAALDPATLIADYKRRHPGTTMLPIEFDLYHDLHEIEDEWFKQMDHVVPKFKGSHSK